MKSIVSLTVKITLDKHSKDAPYVAYTPELDVASCGPTEEKARQNLQEAVQIVLEEVRKKGKLLRLKANYTSTFFPVSRGINFMPTF